MAVAAARTKIEVASLMCLYSKMLMTASKVSWAKWPKRTYFNHVIVRLPAHRHQICHVTVVFRFTLLSHSSLVKTCRRICGNSYM